MLLSNVVSVRIFHFLYNLIINIEIKNFRFDIILSFECSHLIDIDKYIDIVTIVLIVDNKMNTYISNIDSYYVL
jgi:hypothetical protein